MTSFFRRRIIDPLIVLLKQGITPEKLAQSIACGIVMGVFPVLGTTTILCTILAIVLRLNLPAIQLFNWFVYPVQIILLFPFFRIGEILFRAEHLPLSPEQLVGMFKSDFWGSIQALWSTTVHAVVAWIIIGVPIMFVMSWVLTPLLRNLPIKSTTQQA